jgi:hypothetical protein
VSTTGYPPDCLDALSPAPQASRPAEQVYRIGRIASFSLALTTLTTFIMALFAIPISGANCPADCISYPYLDTLTRFPRDYIWMLGAILMLGIYMVWVVAIHQTTSNDASIFSQIALVFALMSALLLIANYFVQFTVVPNSLVSGETEGIALLTQYNPHGIFIALEEAGYLLMSVSFVFMAGVFTQRTRLISSIRRLFRMAFLVVLVALVVMSFQYGMERLDRFEVVIISVNWLVLIVNGVLVGQWFRGSARTS